MSDERFENTNSSRGMSDTDKGYYEDLYNDLPKEVVDILMQTHPLMGKNDDLEATAYRARRPQRREDVEEVREARMQQVSNEINEVSRAPQQEGEPTRYVSRRARNTGIVSENLEGMHTSAPKGNTMDQDDYDDGIQYVSVIPARKKSKIVEEVTLQTTAAPAKRSRKARKEKEAMPFEDMGRDPRDSRPRYEDLDFEERAKQEHLDSLYDDDYDDDYGTGRSKLAIILGVVALILIIFLIFRTVSLNSQLEDAQNQLTQSQEYKQKYEDIQLEKMQLEEQLDNLKGGSTENAEGADGDNAENTDGDTDSSTPASSTSGAGKEYTIKDGDTLWTIAQSQLGNGADYQKILDANGMKESDSLKPGSKIKIPAAN
ncbi:LysM peptidoglycan-binding domain-containing protein [Anaerotignum sp.]|nr:LysM peptidoglycan-binding domain-containing protein [Anaerotignum sp.]MBQ7757651.1 LysM peptidoglycan-binding domain-containing protein [Anaerotignum sp.]